MVSVFEKAFDLPAGHSLRLVRTELRGELQEWEHEEYGRDGRLVAVFESWSRRGAPSPAGALGGGSGFVKYSVNGWVLRRSDTLARRRTSKGEKTLPLMHQPPSLRRPEQSWAG